MASKVDGGVGLEEYIAVGLEVDLLDLLLEDLLATVGGVDEPGLQVGGG